MINHYLSWGEGLLQLLESIIFFFQKKKNCWIIKFTISYELNLLGQIISWYVGGLNLEDWTVCLLYLPFKYLKVLYQPMSPNNLNMWKWQKINMLDILRYQWSSVSSSLTGLSPFVVVKSHDWRLNIELQSDCPRWLRSWH